MSWARGILNGREVGYAIESTCEEPGCDATIDLGLAYRCGGSDIHGDHGCGGYFCYEHQFISAHRGQLCTRCLGVDDCDCLDCAS